MRKLKFIVIFFGFFIFCTAFCVVPSLRPKMLLFRNHLSEMFHIKSDGNLLHNDISIKRIRYINNNSFEVASINNKFINLNLSYKVLKENKSAVLFFLNNISNPIIKVKKQLEEDCFLGDICGIYAGETLTLKEYLIKYGVVYAR